MQAQGKAVLEIETFGGLALRLSGRPLKGFASRKAEAILVYLALAGQPVPRQVLADIFWEEAPETRAMTNLRVALASIKKQLEPFIDIGRQSVRVDAQANLWVDALELARSLAEGDIESGIALYTGEFLDGFHLRGSARFEEWQTITRENYRLQMMDGLHAQVERGLERGDYQNGLRYSRRLLEMDSFDEKALRRTMELLALSGQRNAALLQYETYREIYQDQLGIGPEAETINLWEFIRRGELEAARSSHLPMDDHTPGTGRAAVALHSLPEQLTPFVGRAQELARLEEWLSGPDIRLITILGPGGMGKTRLCLEAGRAQVERFEDGVFFLSLASIDRHDELISALVAALGLRGFDNVDLETVVLNVLAPRKALLLLDNFEHLVREAPFVAEIMQAAPAVKVLVTSREKLNLRHEHVFPLGGMRNTAGEIRKGAGGYGSADLFAQTARRIKPDFTVSPADRQIVDRICQLVEGMPLAIELAASWADTLSLEEIAGRIESGLDILAADMQDAPARHQSIRLVFESNCRTLEPALKETFDQLSVFRGSFTVRAAREVAGASPYQLKTLVNKSLISPMEAGRFQIHELLRQFAEEKLEESPEVAQAARDRHSGFYAEFLTEVGAQVHAGETDEAYQEIDNIRVGFRWAVRSEKIPIVQQYLPGLSQLLIDRGPGEVISLFTWALDRLQAGEPTDQKELTIGSLKGIVGVEEYLSGEHERGQEKALESLLILRRSGRTGPGMAWALLQAVHLRVYGPGYDYDPMLQEGLGILRMAGNPSLGLALNWAGEFEMARGEHEAAQTYLHEALDISTRDHDLRRIAWTYFNLGRVAEAQGALPAAINHYQKSAALFGEIHDQQLYAVLNKYLGNAYYALKQFQPAIGYYQRFLKASRETGIRWRLAEAYAYLGKTMLAMGEIDRAEEYLLQAREICEDPGANVMLGFLLPDLGLLAFTKGDLRAAAENYLTALRNQWADQTKFVRDYAMVLAIPLLEKAGNQALAGNIAAFILADPAHHQITTTQPARDYLEELETRLPQKAYQSILECGRTIDENALQAELEGALQNLQLSRT
ncbi:MAG: tetratricopeptide repeat protein [Anaerolineales bacterium]|nr:tetratricopeptide repeat protein [Anaerolineales bacterium]